MATFHQPKLEVHFTDGTSHIATTLIADQVAYCETARRHGWPTIQEDPTLAGIFMAYNALKRQGEFVDDWSAFQTQAIGITSAGSAAVDPMMPATPGGWSQL